MVQVSQGDVRRYVGVASTVIGLVCYALSSSFNRLYGEWNSFKICAFVVSSSIICLAILFPKAWQHLSIFHYRAHFAFLVSISTSVYSFYSDIKSKTKPDAYALVSSAAFATMSRCMSKSIDCGFPDLMSFFCGVLIIQLMEIKPLLGLVGIGVSYFLITFRSNLDDPNLDDPVPEALYPGSRDNYYAAIGIASLQSISNRASSLDVRPLPPESSIQNFDANFTALEISQLERPPSLEQLQRLQLPGLAELQQVAMPPQLPPPRPRLEHLEQQRLVNQQPQQPRPRLEQGLRTRVVELYPRLLQQLQRQDQLIQQVIHLTELHERLPPQLQQERLPVRLQQRRPLREPRQPQQQQLRQRLRQRLRQPH